MLNSRKRLALASIAFGASAVVTIAAQQPGGARRPVYRGAGGRRRNGVSGQLCELPPARSRGPGHRHAPGRNRIHRRVGARSARELLSFIQLTMPPGSAGALGADVYANIAAFILQSNGARAGNEPLTVELAGAHQLGGKRSRRRSGGAARRRSAGRAGPRRRTGWRTGTRRAGSRRTAGGARRDHRGGGSQELRPGHRGDAPQSRSRRLADDPPRLPRVELQPAQPDHARQRQESAPRLVVGDERRRDESARADRSQRRHLSQQPWQHHSGARRQDGRRDLGEPVRHRRERCRHARHLDVRRQDFCRHERCASVRVRRQNRQDRLGDDDRRSVEGQLHHQQRPARRQGQGDPGPWRLPDVSRRKMLHQRVRCRHRQGGLAVQHGRAGRRARRRHLGQASESVPRRHANRGSPAATIRC